MLYRILLLLALLQSTAGLAVGGARGMQQSFAVAATTRAPSPIAAVHARPPPRGPQARAPAALVATPARDARRRPAAPTERVCSPASQVVADAKTVKKLRDATGAGMMDCKKALVECGDMDAAMEFLRKKGLASADKKASRAAKEGIIETYIHTGSKLGVMVEVNCETDFVAKRPEFQELVKAIAMQIAASPTVEVVSESDISPDFVEKEKRIEAMSDDLKGKPEQIVDKIVTGRVQKLLKTKLLLEQPYIRDPNMNVDELVKSYIARLGENIKVARFVRFNVGEGQTADSED